MVNLRSVVEMLCYMVDEDSDGVEEVMQLPSIDLVRCGECKYCKKYESMIGTEYICDRIWCSAYDWTDRPGFYVSLDDFCSRGEKGERVDEIRNSD